MRENASITRNPSRAGRATADGIYWCKIERRIGRAARAMGCPPSWRGWARPPATTPTAADLSARVDVRGQAGRRPASSSIRYRPAAPGLSPTVAAVIGSKDQQTEQPEYLLQPSNVVRLVQPGVQ